MQKIIGLDIGSYSIKAVEIVNNFKSYEISNFYENVIPHIEELSPDVVIPACMEQLFVENKIVADRIITAMPGQYISSRILPFNFSDPHKVEAAVYAEIEDAVPFNLDDMIIDHQILGQMDAKTIALVVMTRKNFLASFLEHLQRIDIDPKLVDVDSLAFYNLCPYLEMEQGKVYGLVDVGHEKTSVCLVQDGVLRMFRSINLGGRYLTEFLARDLEVPFNEAQRIKHRVSRVLTNNDSGEDLSEEDRRVADRITVASHAILKELGRTLYAFKTWEKSKVERIYLSGGTSVIKNFDVYLADHLEVQTAPNRLEQTALKLNSDLYDKMPIMSQGIAIGIRAVTSVKRHSQINLRKGEFAYVQDYESILKGGGIAFKMVAYALIMLCAAYLVKYWSYNEQTKKVREIYRNEFVNALQDKKDKQKYMSENTPFSKVRRDAESMLQESINSKRLAYEEFVKLNSDSGALAALKEISVGLAPDIKINVVEYNYRAIPDGSGKILLRIEADSFDTIAKFKTALQSLPVLVDLNEKSSDTKPGSDIKVADIEVSYIPQNVNRSS